MSDATPLSAAEAARRIVGGLQPLAAEHVALRDSLGRVLAGDVRSPVALPPWDNSSMDGYAVRAEDVRGASAAQPVTLRVVATVAAGASPYSGTVGRGEAVRIMTGAPVPAGADSVVRVEDSDAGEVRVEIRGDRDAMRNVRPRGEDLAPGDLAGARGSIVTPALLGVLSSVGAAQPLVHRRPRVGILASGDELVDVEDFEAVARGERIVSSNSYTLEALVRSAGGEPVRLGIARDDLADVVARLDAVTNCDLLLTTGGVSVGAFDWVRSALASLGADLRFWRVRIRPGAPLGFGLLRGMPWIGLPGNPVSTMVTFELFARPALRRLAGHALPFRRPIAVRLRERVSINAPLSHFLRVTLEPASDGVYEAQLTGAQGSGLLTSMARADALLIVPANRPVIEAGELVDALLLGERAPHGAECGLPE
ncbi:MAG: MoeA domain protein domain [Gemmatimonadetes bacterium]|nr:MoeA domain protein domain [Gemmatimonadota bacterium]